MNSSPYPDASSQEKLDPVAAYDRLAPYYSHYSQRRAAYLRAVEQQIALRIPPGASSLLDIGAGDGSRATKIAAAAGISRVVLVEPSSRMSKDAQHELWPVRIEEIDPATISERFDVVTCLWNVLGHIQGAEKRARALEVATALLAPRGVLFVDVIYRYNVRSYGFSMTALRWLRDRIAPGESNGDVVADWKTAAGKISAYGHVFTNREMRQLAKSAGLQVVERVVLDYDSGELHRFSCQGNLLYLLRRVD